MQSSRGIRPPRPGWVRSYTWRLVVSDLASLAIATVASHILWFGSANDGLAGTEDLHTSISYGVVGVIVAAGWIVSLRFFGTRDPRIVGSGLTEYARTADASLRWFGVVAILGLLFNVSLSRGYVLTVFVMALFLMLVGRWLWRQWLRQMRIDKGRFLVRVVLVGSAEAAAGLADELSRHAYAGYSVVAFCLVGHKSDETALKRFGVPIYHGASSVLTASQESKAHSIALAGSEGLPPRTVRAISWDLERTGIDLMLAPSLTDIAGPRIHTRPVAGLPLIYVESPRYEGGSKTVKTVFDFSAALIIVILLSPVLLIVGLLVKFTSPGPVFFQQERVGLNGTRFGIIKFRSMAEGADAQLSQLMEERQIGLEPLFKVTNDPRITRIGKFLRATSIDELPQLFNVLKGEMSLVGPRPQVPAEVALYDKDAERRLLVKPGITGLWQISGRSDLPWEEAVRLDLYYVENWSLTDDLIILLRTVRVVFTRAGAH